MATSDIPFYVRVKFSSRSLGVLAGRVYMGVAAKKRHKEREIGEGGEGRKICVLNILTTISLELLFR